MKDFNIENSNYNHKEELKTFLASFNELVDKYNKSLSGKNTALQKLNTSIDKKTSAIEKLNNTAEELTKRDEELQSLKASTSEEIKLLEAKKKTLEYTDSEVMKMEREDIDVLIAAKKGKIEKIDAKVQTTSEKISENIEAIKTAEIELKKLNKERDNEEESIFRTESILALTSTTKETLNNGIMNILNTPYEKKEEVKEEKTEETVEEVKEDYTIADYNFEDLNNINLDIDEPELNISSMIEEIGLPDEESGLSEMNYDDIKLPDEEEIVNIVSDEDDSKLVDVLKKENIDFNEYSEAIREKLSENKDRVIENLNILKTHGVPLELTVKEPDILYMIDSKDLEDLLNVITVDSEGNGMGFAIDYTFYVLNELARINVDKLIEVYNNEFVNVDNKTGLIKLLKLANEDLIEFNENKNNNIDTLRTLGVETVDDIVENYPEFINLDNPLFLDALNLFDKEDLVSKMNSDIKIVPKIMDYWQNN